MAKWRARFWLQVVEWNGDSRLCGNDRGLRFRARFDIAPEYSFLDSSLRGNDMGARE
jgi:hypothetical protein